RDQQRAAELVEELRKALRVDAAQRRVGGGRPFGAARRRDRAAQQLAGALCELVGARQQLTEGTGQLRRGLLRRDRELVAERAEWPGHVLGGLDPDELTDPLQLALRVVEQRLEVGDAPALRNQGFEVVEERAGQPKPLLGDYLRKRLAG